MSSPRLRVSAVKGFRVIPGWSAAVILVLEFLFFTLILWRPGESHTFANAENVALILKYSGIYGISAIGAAMIIGAGGIDLAPGAVMALASVVTGELFVEAQWPLPAAIAAGLSADDEDRRQRAAHDADAQISAANSGCLMASRIEPSPRMARYSGSDRPAWRMNHTGVCGPRTPCAAAMNAPAPLVAGASCCSRAVFIGVTLPPGP